MPEHTGIFYTDRGKGFPVLFLHGFCETHEIWNEFSNGLSKDFRVLTIDLPGFGESKRLNSDFSLTDVASEVLGWLKALRIDSCIAIGHSLGGYVTLAMAEQDPGRFRAFGLFHSTAYADTEERKLSRNKVMEFVSKHGVKPFIESFIPPLFFDQSNQSIKYLVNLASQTRTETLIAYAKAMRDRPDRTQVLANFKGSVLILGGEKDGGISPDSLKTQSNLTLRPKLHILKDVAHMGMFECEDYTLELISQFLSGEVKNYT